MTGKNGKPIDTQSIGNKVSEECAGCGEKNPEYILDERQLCADCYKAETKDAPCA